jgi:hypothetical protein
MTEALADVEAGRMTEAVRTAPPDKISRTERELRRLNTSYNPTANRIEEDQDEEIVFHSTGDANYVQVHYVYNATLASDPGEPKNLGEALQSSESEYWINGVRKEIENFMNRGAWKRVPLSAMKKGQRPIFTKWIFKKKNEHDGTTRYKGRIVVRGFVQIPGVDFNHTHSPVATDVGIKIVIAITLYFEDEDWEIDMLDIEAAFLEAKLDEDVSYSGQTGSLCSDTLPRKTQRAHVCN